MKEINTNDAVNITLIDTQKLDMNPHLEQMLIETEQDKMLYMTIFLSLIMIILNYFAW